MQWWHSKVLKTGCSVRKFLNLEYGPHKVQAIIFWGCIQGMNQQNCVTIHVNISIRVLNEPFLR